MESTLRDMGLGSVTYNYDVPVDRRVVGHGTVVVISSMRQDTMPSIYVENRLVTDPDAVPTDAEIVQLLEKNTLCTNTVNVDPTSTPNLTEHGAQLYYFSGDKPMATDTTRMHGEMHREVIGQSSAYNQPEVAADTMWMHSDTTQQGSLHGQSEAVAYTACMYDDATSSMAVITTWMHRGAAGHGSTHTQRKAVEEFTDIQDVQNDPAYNGTNIIMSSSTSTTTQVKVNVEL